MKRALSTIVPLLLTIQIGASSGAAHAAREKKAPTETEPQSFAATVEGLERREGLLTYYLDPEKGKVWLEVPAEAWEEPLELLYIEGLVSGLGSNPVGLDRGQLGPTRVVRLRPVGGKLLIEQRNLGYRALSSNPREVAAVESSFATSVLWAGAITARRDDGTGLVDLTPFLVRDAHRVVDTLKQTGQGTFKLDPERSAVDLDACKAFPDNIELEAVLTYAGSDVGEHVRATAPTADSVTLVEHHSFVRLPDDGYQPRAFDPRAGSFAIEFADYAAGLAEPLEKRWIVRHRLEKTDPGAASSPVVEPIVYYVDSGAPPAIQQALIEGASWWADAFAAAGFEDAFRVEVLPADADPLDVRYNVIQWVHRSTRGWSYGGGVIDPRTGEMIKGHVTLGSLRVRQDRLIFEALAGAQASGTGAPDDPVELALARIRQLAAHEVGHTLGLAHNFAASTYGRASVMDYPAPLVTVAPDGTLDFDDAYAVGVGEWDLHAIRWAYAQFPPGSDEGAELDRMIDEAERRGLRFVTDADARPPGAAQPWGNLWDNGSDPVAELARLGEVRRVALERFGLANLGADRPVALLHETLVPLYFLQRFQILAAAKVLGGLDYRYALPGDDETTAKLLDPDWQRRALAGLLDVVEPQALDLDESILELLLPRPFGYDTNRELTASSTAPAFDALGAAATLADMVMSQILQPERLARLADQHRREASQPGVDEVLGELVRRLFEDVRGSEARQREIERAVQSVAVDRMLELERSKGLPVQVAFRLDATLRGLAARLAADRAGDDGAFAAHLRERIERFLERGEVGTGTVAGAAEPPPGQPIGLAPWLDGIESWCSWSGSASDRSRIDPWSRR